MRLKGAAYGLVLCVALAGPAMAVEPEAPEQLITRLDAVGIEVQKRLAEAFRVTSAYDKDDKGALVEYYSDRTRSLVWVDSSGLTKKALLVIDEMKRAEDYGLKPDAYKLPELASAREGEMLPASQLADAELMLSRAVLAYARDARGGRIVPGSLGGSIDPSLNLPDPLAVIAEIATRDDPAPYLRGFHPQHPQFEALRKIVMEIRGGGEPRKQVVIPDGPVIKPGESHKQVVLVRQRLGQAEQAGEADEKFGPELEEAVKEFQQSRGLAADGIIGPATRRAMNARPENRLKTILVNMERWRWIAENQDFSIQVNVPEFLIRVFENDKAIHTERVVAGKIENPTPVFSDKLEYIVFHPYWNVPVSIAREEILPNVRRPTLGDGWFGGFTGWNSRFLARYNIRVKYNGKTVDPSSVNWSNVDVRRLNFYQPPGKGNVLGVVKFIFPNHHTVYMHDTPSKHLFNQPVRAYSHGCMRIRDPLKLAEILLGHDSGWTAGRVAKAVELNQNQHVKLETPIPVHITYFTARATPDGQVRYFGDLYGHDARMAKALGL